MIQYAGITLLTDDEGNPVQVNIDLTRHGGELAAFLHSHGLSDVKDSLKGALPGNRLTPLYRQPMEQTCMRVLYSPVACRLLRNEVTKVLERLTLQLRPVSREEYVAALTSALERQLYTTRSRRSEVAPDAYARYGKDMFRLRFHLRIDRKTLWCACYTLHETNVLVRYVGRALE